MRIYNPGNLTPEQADGLACVECGTSFLRPDAPIRKQVGTVPYRSKIYACEGDCQQKAESRDVEPVPVPVTLLMYPRSAYPE